MTELAKNEPSVRSRRMAAERLVAQSNALGVAARAAQAAERACDAEYQTARDAFFALAAAADAGGEAALSADPATCARLAAAHARYQRSADALGSAYDRFRQAREAWVAARRAAEAALIEAAGLEPVVWT